MDNSSLGPLPDWARPLNAPPASGRGDGAERRSRFGRGRKGEKAEQPETPAPRVDVPVAAVPVVEARPRAVEPPPVVEASPTVAPPAVDAPPEPPPAPPPPVHFDIDPAAPVHPEYGRRIALEWFATKHVEVYEEGYVRLTGPLVAAPPFERLVSIDYWADSTPKTRRDRLLGKVGSSNLRELGIPEPLREAVLTIVTTERSHTLREEDMTEAGARAAGVLVTAAAYIADQMWRRMPPPEPEPVVLAEPQVEMPDFAQRFLDEAPPDLTRVEIAVEPPPPPVGVPRADLPKIEIPRVELPPVEVPKLDLRLTLPPLASAESAEPARFGLTPVPPARSANAETDVRSIPDRLRDLAALHAEGLVSDEEYAIKRQQLLDQL